MNDEQEAFEAWAASRQHGFLRSAVLLTADQSSAEDLVQDALLKVADRWSRLRYEAPDAYARRIIYNGESLPPLTPRRAVGHALGAAFSRRRHREAADHRCSTRCVARRRACCPRTGLRLSDWIADVCIRLQRLHVDHDDLVRESHPLLPQHEWADEDEIDSLRRHFWQHKFLPRCGSLDR